MVKTSQGIMMRRKWMVAETARTTRPGKEEPLRQHFRLSEQAWSVARLAPRQLRWALTFASCWRMHSSVRWAWHARTLMQH